MPESAKSRMAMSDVTRSQSLLPVAPRSGVSAKGYFWLGLFLLAALIVQQSTGWQWTQLAGLQADNTYKLATGLGLFALILFQWRFSVKRAQGEQRRVASILGRHKWFGTLLPLLFLGHSQSLGYGYAGILSLTVLTAFLTGLFNCQIVKIHKPWYRPLWIIAHVGLSMALLLLVVYHVYLDYAFK